MTRPRVAVWTRAWLSPDFHRTDAAALQKPPRLGVSAGAAGVALAMVVAAARGSGGGAQGAVTRAPACPTSSVDAEKAVRGFEKALIACWRPTGRTSLPRAGGPSLLLGEGPSQPEPGPPPSTPPPSPSPADVTAAAMLLQLDSHTAVMEDMVRQGARDVEAVPGVTERIEAGLVVLRREDLVQSARVMLENSGLAAIPGAEKAAGALRSIAGVAEAGEGPLSADEFGAIANSYAAVGKECRRVFEALPPEQQDQARESLA